MSSSYKILRLTLVTGLLSCFAFITSFNTQSLSKLSQLDQASQSNVQAISQAVQEQPATASQPNVNPTPSTGSQTQGGNCINRTCTTTLPSQTAATSGQGAQTAQKTPLAITINGNGGTQTSLQAHSQTTANPTPPSTAEPCEDFDLDSGLIECQRDHFLDLIEKCDGEKGQKKTSCYKKAEKFFKDDLRKSLSKGLSQPIESDLFTEASEARDDLIQEMPSHFDRIRTELLRITQVGTTARLHQNYHSALIAGATPGYAATIAKNYMTFETNFHNPNSVGGQLLSSLLDHTEDSKTLSPRLAQLLFYQNFYSPLQQIWSQDHSKGFETTELHNFNLDSSLDFSQVPGLRTASAPGLSLPNNFVQVRTQGQRVPPLFQTPLTETRPLGPQSYDQQTSQYTIQPSLSGRPLSQSSTGFSSPFLNSHSSSVLIPSVRIR
jgi:hypothetical protein